MAAVSSQLVSIRDQNQGAAAGNVRRWRSGHGPAFLTARLGPGPSSSPWVPALRRQRYAHDTLMLISLLCSAGWSAGRRINTSRRYLWKVSMQFSSSSREFASPCGVLVEARLYHNADVFNIVRASYHVWPLATPSVDWRNRYVACVIPAVREIV